MNKRFTNRLLALLLAWWLVASFVLPARAVDANRIIISTPEEFLLFGQNCALDTWSQGKTVRLAADLDLTGVDISPIPSFGGVFQGQGHTISGLCLTGPGSTQGLFRYIQPEGVVRDLTVEGTVAPGGTRSTVGGIVGNNAGTLQNCTFHGTVEGESAVGGIAGRNSVTGNLIDCSVSGSVSGENATGGVAGRNFGVLLRCENRAGVNLTEGESSVDLLGEDAGTVLEERAVADDETYHLLNSCSDTGGVVGRSNGVVQSCVNYGTVGYPHVGYNTGGIAGRQSGYLAGCVNYGTVHGRKDVGGIVGQAEPDLVADPGRDTLERLRTELDTLDRMINRVLDNTQGTGDDIALRLEAMGDYTDGARDSSKRLLDRVSGFTDENIGAVNTLTADITNALDQLSPALDDLSDAGRRLEQLSDQLGDALDELDRAVDVGDRIMGDIHSSVGELRQAGNKLSQAAGELDRALDALLKGIINKDDQAKAAALAQVRTAAAVLSEGFRDSSVATGGLRDALEEAGGLPGTGDALPALGDLEKALDDIAAALNQIRASLPTLDGLKEAGEGLRRAFDALRGAGGDLDDALSGIQTALSRSGALSGKLGDALRELQEASNSSAAIGRLLRRAFDTAGDAIDGLTGGGPVEFTPLGEEFHQASDDLYRTLGGLSDEMAGLREAVQSGGDTMTADLRAISRQFNVVFDVLLDALAGLQDMDSGGMEDLIQDTSEENIAATREGKVADCRNAGAVEGDRNVGGVVGAMAIEFDLDPEDDVAGLISSTYETKAVLQNCRNYGGVTAKKDCVGGLVGRMDLGMALDGQNYGPVTSTGGDYVGGVAGFASASVRGCYAKNTLSGGSYVGGIAGWAGRLRNCYAIATITEGSECLGAIAGGMESDGVLQDNYFVNTGIAGVDGVSYAGRAEPIPFDALSRFTGVPPEFTAFTLTLVANEETVAQIPFLYGEDLSRIELPPVPELDGNYGVWPEFDRSGTISDLTLEAVYAPWVTVVASQEQSGKLALALAEGRFTEEVALHITESAQTPPPEAAEGAVVWDVSLTGSRLSDGDSLPLRLLSREKASVWQYRDGRWQAVETVQNGQYLLLTMEGTQGTFWIQPQAGPPWMLLAAAAAGVVLAVLLLIAGRKKKKAAKAAKVQREKEAAAKE